MDDETFDKFIVVDGSEDGEKENVAANQSRQPKTTQKQFDLIVEFMKCHNEELIDKELFSRLWHNLAAELNDVGPPEHTVVEWKKIWSAHKSYNNRKRTSSEPLRIHQHGKVSRHDRPVEESTAKEAAAEDGIASCSSNETATIGKELLRKVDVIIENQKTLIESLNSVAESLKSALSK